MLRFLASKGIDARDWRPTPFAEITDLSRFKTIVAIGAEAAAVIPKRLGFRTIRLEWDVADPSAAAAGPTDVTAACSAIFDDLVTRISELIRDLHGTVAQTATSGGTR